MNMQYRLVWNKSLRMVQVASELAHRPKGGSPSASGASATPAHSALPLKGLSFAAWVALGMVSVIAPVNAGQVAGLITADPNAPGNQRPTVLGSPGNAALINITTPTKAGVSINQYSAFQVDSHGAVLNNSRDNTQTTLAGTIGGNPWLATGSARVIVNQVNSSSPAALGGYIEVAGDKAQVVIASPAGIAVDGGGFLNASRVTLTTGTPLLNGGALEGYRVNSSGIIQVSGNGLDASRADYTDIIARAAVLDGAVYAQQLRATFGANQVNTDQSQVTPIQGAGTKPAFALDTSALGGMYANKIVLLANEQGVGVRNAGTIAASAGNVVVTVDGRLENTGSLQSLSDTNLSASGGLSNNGTISATNTLAITTPLDVDNSRGTLNAGRIALDAASLRNQAGTIAQTSVQGMSLQAGALSNSNGGSIGMPVADAGDDSSASSSSGGSTTPPGGGTGGDGDAAATGSGSTGTTPVAPLADGALHIAGLLDNDGGRISAAAGFDLTTANGLANDGGQLGLRQLTMTGGDLSNQGGTLTINGAANIQGGNVINDAGQLNFADTLILNVQNLSNRGGTLTHVGTAATTLSVADALDNTGGTLASNASSLAITSGMLVNEGGQISHTGLDRLTVTTNALYGAGGKIATAGAVQLTAGAVDHQQAILAATQVTVNAASFDNRGGAITASGDNANTLQVAGTLDNSDGGTIASNADLSLQASMLGNASGTIQHAGAGTLRIDATTLNGVGGTIGSNGQLYLTGVTTDLSGGNTSAQSLAISTSVLSTAHGTLIAAGSDPLQMAVTGAYDNTGGQVSTGGGLQLNAASLTNVGGSVVAVGTGATNLTVTNRLDNTGGTLAAAGATTVQAHDLINQGGTLQVSGAPLSVTANGLLDNSQHGVLASDGDLTLQTATLDNTAGTIQHAGQGAATITATTLNGQGGAIASNGDLTLHGGALNLRDSTTTAQSVTVNADALTTAGGTLQALGGSPLNLTVRGLLDNMGGQIATNGSLHLTAQALSNANGTLQAAGSDATVLTITQAFDNTHGILATAGATTVHAGSLDNTAGTLQAASDDVLTVSSDGALINDGGTLVGNGALALSAGSLSNHGGTLQAQQAIDATVAGTLDNSNGGTVIAGGDLNVQADSLLNRNTLNTSAPQGLYGDHVQLRADTLDNTQGQIHANDSLAVRGQIASGGAITNAGGSMDGTGTVSVAAITLDNTGGQLIQRGHDGLLSLNVTQALTNTGGGLIGAEGTATIHAGSFDNSGGTAAAQGDLTLASDGDLLNRNSGVLQTQGTLTLGANGAFDNSAGQLDAAGAATIAAASVSNVGGQLLAGDASNPGAALQITSGSTLDNRGGTIGNRGGDVTLHAASIDNSSNGTLVAQRDLTLDRVSVLNNTGGTTYATRNLSFQNGSATLDNTGGQLGAGDTAWLDLGQITNNAGGHLQAATLWLTTPTLFNDDGEVDGAVVHATLASLNGVGRIYGSQLLDAHVTGDYTHLAGQRLESDGVLSLTVDGTLINQGTLQTQGELDLSAANLINTHGAVINASADDGSGVANLRVSGSVDNQQGATLEGDTLNVSANTLTNTGDIVGDVVTLDASSLTNGRDLGTATAAVDYGEGFIGASQVLNLHVGTLANLDAQLYSAGDLTIAADAAGNQAQSILNRSGLIQAEGNLSLAAQQIANARRVFQTEVYTLSPAEQAQNTFTQTVAIYRDDDPNPLHHPPYVDPSQVLSAAQIAQLEAFCGGKGSPGKDGDQWCNGITMPGQSNAHNIYHNDLTANVTDTLVSVERLVSASATGEIVSGGDMTLTGAVLNDKSTIAAGRNLTIYDPSSGASGTASVQNIAWTPTGTVQETTTEQTGIGYVSFSGDRHWDVEPYKWTWGIYQSSSTINVAQGNAPTWVTYSAGPGLAGSITAVGSVTIIGGDVTNTVVGGGGGVSGITPGGLAGPGSTTFQSANGAQAGSAGTIAATAGQTVNGPGHQGGAAGQTIGDTNSPLPGYTPPNNPTVQQHPDANAPFLVTTAPRFAQGASTSSDYLLRALGDDPSNMQKRLGDGYVEQNLVMDQILQLTGRRSLSGGDPMAQYQSLMDGAASEAARLGLQLGAPLTSAQIASLDTDIVWLVDQVVDGQHVLTPVVYLSKATADRMQHEGALIAGDTVNVASTGTVRNDGTISGTQGTWLSADTLINTGAMKSDGTLAIATRNDTINSGTLSAGAISVTAGRDLLNTGSITSNGDMALVAGRDLTTGVAPIQAGGNLAMVAGRDLTATASTISAVGDAQLMAGNNLTLNATGHTTRTGGASNGQESTTHAVTAIQAGGDLAVVAGNDLTSDGTQLSAGNRLGLAAGHDLTLNTVTDHQSNYSKTVSGHTITTTRADDDTVRGSSLSGANGVALTAGHDLTATATTMTSTNGAIGLMAGHDLTLDTAQDTHSTVVDTKKTGGNVLSHSTTRTHDSVSDTYAIGTTVSGSSVTMAAGNNLTATAAQVVADHDTVMAAGNNLTLNTANDVHTEDHSVSKTKTGVMGAGVGVMVGEAKQSQDLSITQTTPTGTTVGSLGGSVTMTAGNNVHLTNATVLSDTGTAIVGNNVTIDAAMGITDTTQTYKQSSAGLHVGLTGGAVTVAQTVYHDAKGISKSSDSRLQALYAAQGAEALLSPGAGRMMGLGNQTGADAIGQAAQGNTNSAGISLRIGIGASSASAKASTHDETAYGSTIHSNGNVMIAATGGDLNVIGSQISGDNVALAAANNLNLLSQAEQHTDQSSNHNAGGEVGFSVGATTGWYASASAGQGKAHGNGTTHATTSVDAANTLTLVSGGDTTIQGAQAKGNTVLANIGGNLNVISEQDTDHYTSKQQQASATVATGSGMQGSYNQSNAHSDYTSVTTVSGIGAGDGGFAIHVNGNTDLKGGVIASTADASKNLLDTGSLTFSDIENHASYSASSVGVGTGGPMGLIGLAGLAMPQTGNESSTTKAGIADGTIITRNGDTDLSGLDRKPDINASGLTSNFDEKKIQDNMLAGQLAGQVGMVAAGDLENVMQLTPGSAGATAIHTVAGGAIAALGGGNVAQGALGAGAGEAFLQYLPGIMGPQEAALASAVVGGVVGGGTGLATANAGAQYNYLTHPQLIDLQNQIIACNGDRSCIESAKTDAEITSAKQEQDLKSGCGGNANNYSDACKGAILDARAYASDPLASQLGLQVDQAITTQDYMANRYHWGLVAGESDASQMGNYFFIPPAVAVGAVTMAAAGPIVAGSGSAIGAISGGTGGYISGGWKGAGIGVLVGGVAGEFIPGAGIYVAGQVGGTTGMVAGAGTFVVLNGLTSGAGALATNVALGQPWNHGLPYAIGAGMVVPLASGEAVVVGFGGEAAVGTGVANAFSAYSGLFSIGAAAVDPTPTPKKQQGNQGK